MIAGIILCSHEEDPTGSKFLIQNVVEKKTAEIILCVSSKNTRFNYQVCENPVEQILPWLSRSNSGQAVPGSAGGWGGRHVHLPHGRQHRALPLRDQGHWTTQ